MENGDFMRRCAVKKIRSYAGLVFLLCGIAEFSGCGRTAYESIAVNAYQYGESQLSEYGGANTSGSDESAADSGRAAEAGGAEASDGEVASAFSQEQDTDQREETIIVYVCGAVKRSGVVTLPEGSRVYEAIEAAGGLTEDADERLLNQAMMLADGDQITVLTKDEAGTKELQPVTNGSGGTSGETSGGKININTADLEALQQLSGIGAAKAADIIAYREANGAFRTIEDIMKVSGIKTALFNRIKDGITVG